MSDYCTGLLLPCERKSVEPIAAAMAARLVSPSRYYPTPMEIVTIPPKT
jgi:hypothetical protein